MATETKAKQPKLTPKEIKFLKGLAQGKTKTQAAMDAYDTTSEKSASVIAAQNLGKVRIKDALEQAYQNSGITSQSIADVLSDAMLATKTIQAAGQLVDTHVPDHPVRVNAARTAAQLIGAGRPDDNDKGPTINFNIGTKNYVSNS